MNTDKFIGTVTIAAVLLVVIYVGISMWITERRAHDTVHVQFPEMGALQNEDAVVIRGLLVGNVASIKKVNGKALVEIDLDEPRIFPKDTRFRNVSPNIMGSRNIVIEPGKSGELAPLDYVFEGEFEPGFAEILALSDVVKEHVATLMEMVRLLHTGDENNTSLQQKVEDFIQECEDIIAILNGAVSTVEKEVMGTLDKAAYYTEQISDASNKIGETLDSLRVQAKDGIESIEEVVLNVKGTIENLNRILTEFENNPVTEALLNKREIIDDIDSLRVALNAFINSIDKEGIKIYDEKGKRKSMVSLKNIHPIRETARSKAKKRAAQP